MKPVASGERIPWAFCKKKSERSICYLALLVLLSMAIAPACVSRTQIKADSKSVEADIARARRAGAYKCAPNELAIAVVNADFARGESDKGNSRRAQEHISIARENVKRALELSSICNKSSKAQSENLETPPSSPKDTDGDGIPDDVDRCPNETEDKDGFADHDGCPDLDNDSDGVTDSLDACPNVSGPAENSGCPRILSMVEVKGDRIEIKQQINFQPGKAEILGQKSFELLDQVVQALNDYSAIKKISIEGHTDSSGKAASNMKLSKLRAEAVRNYLIRKGVSVERVSAVGFGDTQPISSNATEKGQAMNRRTEFKIVERN